MQRDAADINAERADRFEARAKRGSRRVIGRIFAVALFILSCMWLFIDWSLWSEYKGAEGLGRTEGYNLTAALARELTTSLDSATAEFPVIEKAMRDVPPGAPDAAMQDRLRPVVVAAKAAGTDIRIAGPNGQRLISSIDSDRGPADFLSQPHFIAHRDDPAVGLVVDQYFRDAAEPIIEVSRRLTTAEGNFAGEAMLLLRPGKLITLNRQFNIGRRGMIVIADADGVVRAGFDAAHPEGTAGVGTDLRGAPYPEHLAPGAVTTYSRQGRIVHIERMIAIRRLRHYPLRVLIALDLDDVLGSARSHIWVIGLVGVAATGLMTTLTLLLVREVWRRTRREIDLAYDRDRLRVARAQIEEDRARLAETNRELETSRESVETATRARSLFLAHMSHELRTPLHAIIGFSELIQDQAPAKPGAPPIAGYAADIWSSGRHLLELINAILDISKVESGTATLTETVFPVAELIRSSVVSVRAQADARHIAIGIHVSDAIFRIRADRTRLLQILINLLSNAVKFTPDDGRIGLTVAVSAAGEPVFSITDTGIGMTEAEIEVALEPFGQVDSTLSRSFEGTGLGLPLARRLTELHGGKLELTSVKGKGTTVRVVMPAERLFQRDAVRSGGE